MRIAIHVGKRHSLNDQRLFRTAKALKFGIGNSHVVVNPSLKDSFDILHAHDLDALPRTILHKALTSPHSMIVYDSHEDWQSYPKLQVRLAESTMLAFVDAAISPSPAITAKLAKRVKITQTILNCPELPPPPTEPKYPKFTVAYAGHINSKRGYGHLLEAARILKQQGLDIQYLLMGSGTIDIPDDLKLQFEVTGQLPHDEMMKRLQRCHLGLIPFEDTPNHRIALPHKLFEYMAVGIPVIAPIHCAEIRHIIDITDCGAVTMLSSDNIASAIQWLFGNPTTWAFRHTDALAAAKNEYNAPVQAAKLTALYGRLL